MLIVTDAFLSGVDYDRNITRYVVDYSSLAGITLPIGPIIPPRSSHPSYDEPNNSEATNWQANAGNFSDYFSSHVDKLQNSVSQMKRLTNEECIDNYSTRVVTGRTSILAVTTSNNSSDSLFRNDARNGSLLFVNSVESNMYLSSYPASYPPFNYICSGLDGYSDRRVKRCSPDMIDPTSWDPFDYPIKYRLSEIVEERYQLQYNQAIGVIVIVCNAAKVYCMLHAALNMNLQTLCTQG